MVAADDLARMRAQPFFEDLNARTRAGAGVAGDSTPTVIGATIVAPLMSPILGTVLAMVRNDRPNLLRCIATRLPGCPGSRSPCIPAGSHSDRPADPLRSRSDLVLTDGFVMMFEQTKVAAEHEGGRVESRCRAETMSRLQQRAG